MSSIIDTGIIDQLRHPIRFSSLNQVRAKSQNSAGTVIEPSSIAKLNIVPAPAGPGIVARTWHATVKFIATASLAGKTCQ